MISLGLEEAAETRGNTPKLYSRQTNLYRAFIHGHEPRTAGFALLLLTVAPLSDRVGLSLRETVFVGVHRQRQIVVSRQDLSQSRVVLQGVAGQTKQTGPEAVTVFIQVLDSRGSKESKQRAAENANSLEFLCDRFFRVILYEDAVLRHGEPTFRCYRCVCFGPTFMSSLGGSVVPVVLC